MNPLRPPSRVGFAFLGHPYLQIANSLQILFLPRSFALCLVLCFYQPAACTHAPLSSIASLWAILVLVNHAVSLFLDFGRVHMNLGNVNSKQIVLGYVINISRNSPCQFLFVNSSIPFMLSAVLVVQSAKSDFNTIRNVPVVVRLQKVRYGDGDFLIALLGNWSLLV